MSKQTNEAVFAPFEAKYKSIVMHNTWGHLFPDKKQYKGTVRIAHSIYGDIVILDEDIDIGSSPWWFEAINNFAGEMVDGMESGGVREVKIVVDIVDHKDPDEDNDPDHPEDDVFSEYQTIEITPIVFTDIIVAY